MHSYRILIWDYVQFSLGNLNFLNVTGVLDIANPNPQKAVFEKALVVLQSGDAEAAEKICRDALSSYPEDANILCLSARALIRLKRFDESEKRLNQVLSLFPQFARPHEILAELFNAQGRPKQASTAFKKAIELGANSPDIHQKLSISLAAEGEMEDAALIAQQSNQKHPNNVAIVEARELFVQGDLVKAETIFQDLLIREPDNVDVLAGIGAVAVANQQYTDAEIFLQSAVTQSPDFAQAWADLVIAQMELEKYDEAVNSAESLFRLNPDETMSQLLLANACAMAGKYDEALTKYEHIASEIPGDLAALSGMGHMLKTVGRQEESIGAYQACIQANPQHTEAWWGLANMKTYQFSQEEIAEMQRLLQSGDAKVEPTSRWLTSTPEVNLCNALGMAFEACGKYDQAFEYFKRGNDKRRLDEPYDPVYVERLHDRIIETFNHDFFFHRPDLGNQSKEAIFIVGLPRTGSTLIEQILASHPQVDGTFELQEVGRIIQSLPINNIEKSQFPENIKELEPHAFEMLGVDYIHRTGKYRSGRGYFTDKNLGNFMHVGLLHLLLPNAVIINARRHPMDTCLGCYKQLFARGQSFTYDLEELGEYYLQYERLMDHWDSVLPGKVLHVQYEDVVNDLEVQIRRLLDHCNLAWDDNCLRFFETKRAVRTASSEQVRQPIYHSSLNLWYKYKSQLSILIDIIDPEMNINLP